MEGHGSRPDGREKHGNKHRRGRQVNNKMGREHKTEGNG